MRITLGILLIAAGVFGAYMILTGRFPSSGSIPTGGEKSTPPASSGGTSDGNLTPGTGSGGQSWQSALVSTGDRLASLGGMHAR